MSDQPSRRRRFQFRLRTLMTVVAAVAFGAAAIRFSTPGWAIATVSLTVLLLLFSVVLAAYRRPFWVGFAICGIGYLMLTVMPFTDKLHYLLITTQSILFLENELHAADFPPYSAMPEQFHQIGECLWALILASLGGMLARFAANRSSDEAGRSTQ